MKNTGLKWLIMLHILLGVYSMSGILSKLAGQASFLSIRFILCYAGVIGLLGVYAIGWQQIIKRMDLTTAFANKAVTVVWGIVWGWLFFGEAVTVGKLIGAAVVISGVILYVRADTGEERHE